MAGTRRPNPVHRPDKSLPHSPCRAHFVLPVAKLIDEILQFEQSQRFPRARVIAHSSSPCSNDHPKVHVEPGKFTLSSNFYDDAFFQLASHHELVGLLKAVNLQNPRAMFLKLMHDGQIQIGKFTGRDQD